MAGEMTKEEVTKDAYPFHFAVAKSLGGSVKPFDQYQGPYVYAYGFGRFWLNMEDGESPYCYWYNDYTGKKSEPFYAYEETNRTACRCARQCLPDGNAFLVKGGTVIEEED